MSDRYYHINACVYELVVTHEGETKHLMKQVNNPLFCTDLKLSHMTSITPSEVIMELKAHEPQTGIFLMHPINDDHMNERYDFTVLRGYTLRGKRPDPKKPVMKPTGMTEEEHRKFLSSVLEPTFEKMPFAILIPETDNYMWDLSISHVPDKAVTFLGKEEPLPEDIANAEGPMLSADGMFHAGSYKGVDPRIGEEVFRQASLWKTQHPDEPFQLDIDLIASRLEMTPDEIRDTLDKCAQNVQELQAE